MNTAIVLVSIVFLTSILALAYLLLLPPLQQRAPEPTRVVTVVPEYESVYWMPWGWGPRGGARDGWSGATYISHSRFPEHRPWRGNMHAAPPKHYRPPHT